MENPLGYESHAYFYYGGTGLNSYTDIPYSISNQPHDLATYIRNHQFQVITFINTLYNLELLNEVGYQGKVIFEFHGESSGIFEELTRINDRHLAHEIHAVVVPSRNVERIARNHLPNRQDLPILVAYNTLDTDVFTKQPVDSFCDLYDIPNEWQSKPLLGWVGRLNPNKNWHLLLRIFRKLKEKYKSDVKLLVASDVTNSPHLNQFFKKVMKYGLMNDVLVLPNVPYDRMPYFYSLLASSGGALLSTSYREGYPYNLLEAQASYCPIVCTDIEGLEEIVNHTHTGSPSR